MEQEKEELGLREDSRLVITCKKGCKQGFDLSRSWRTDVVQDRDEVGGETGKVPRDQLQEVPGILRNQATKMGRDMRLLLQLGGCEVTRNSTGPADQKDIGDEGQRSWDDLGEWGKNTTGKILIH